MFYYTAKVHFFFNKKNPCKPICQRTLIFVIASEAKQSGSNSLDCFGHYHPRNDGDYSLFSDPTGLACAASRLCQYTETNETNRQKPPAAINIQGLRLIR